MQSTTTPRAHRAPRPLLPRPSKQPTAVSHPSPPFPHSPNSLSSASRPPIDWYADQFNTISVGQNPYLVSSPQKRETLGSWRDNSNAHNIRAPPPSPQKSEAGHDNTRPYTPLDGEYWCSAGHMQPTCLDRLTKRPGEEERKVGEIQRVVEGERLKENVEQKNRKKKKKKKKKKNDDQTFSGVDIAAGEGSLEGVEVLSKPLPVPAGRIDWARAWQIQGGAALDRCPRLGSACVEEGESGGFDSVLLGGLTPEQIKQRMCETQSWYIESVDRDGGSNAMGWSGSIPTVPVAHPEDKARGGEGKRSLEGIMIADMLQKANIAEYRLKRARERIQKLEQALVVMGKEVEKCWEEEQRLAQRVGEIECRNRLIGAILDEHAQRGFERGD